MDMTQYRKIKLAETNRIISDVEGHWLSRIVAKGLHELGENGVAIYLSGYGTNIGEPKVVHLAVKAEREGYPDFAMGFWKKAFELSIGKSPNQNGSKNVQKPKSKKAQPIKILFLSSNPVDTERLRIDQEIRSIRESLRQAKYRDKFDVQQERAVRAKDLQKYFLQHRPDIVHFSGHGSATLGIVLEDDYGGKHTVPPEVLGKLFQVQGAGVRCVVLNACYTLNQATIIAKHVDCVIGMTQAIADESATLFATAFYQSLAYAKDIKFAFESGILEIALNHLPRYDEDTPVLVANRVDPATVIFM